MINKEQTKIALELINSIEQAFATVKKVDKTLEQCYITDEYGMGGVSLAEFDKMYNEAGKVRPYDNWDSIPKEVIEKYNSPFCNMSNEEYAFYLPAYMRYVIKNQLDNTHKNWWECEVLLSVAFYLGYEHDYEDFQYMYSAMSNQQKKVILEYAIFIVDLSYNTIKNDDFFDNKQKKFWHEYHLESILKAKNRVFGYFSEFLDW